MAATFFTHESRAAIVITVALEPQVIATEDQSCTARRAPPAGPPLLTTGGGHQSRNLCANVNPKTIRMSWQMSNF
jgi:hypothetical protein